MFTSSPAMQEVVRQQIPLIHYHRPVPDHDRAHRGHHHDPGHGHRLVRRGGFVVGSVAAP